MLELGVVVVAVVDRGLERVHRDQIGADLDEPAVGEVVVVAVERSREVAGLSVCRSSKDDEQIVEGIVVGVGFYVGRLADLRLREP